jgi:hypothetical protein
MTKILIVLSLAVLSTAFRPIPPPASTPPTVLRTVAGEGMVVPDCYTFTVDNTSSDSIGNIRVNGASTYADFNVTATASYEQSVCFTASSVTVNGTTIDYPNSGNVQLASGVWVKVIWQSSSLIEIADEHGTNSPVRQ